MSTKKHLAIFAVFVLECDKGGNRCSARAGGKATSLGSYIYYTISTLLLNFIILECVVKVGAGEEATNLSTNSKRGHRKEKEGVGVTWGGESERASERERERERVSVCVREIESLEHRLRKSKIWS